MNVKNDKIKEINYVELLRQKKKHASQTGNCFYKAKTMIEN
jgi:hypothetical protein